MLPELHKSIKDFGGVILLLGEVGSRAYGTNTVDSDYDVMGVGFGPIDYYIGMNNFHSSGTFEFRKNVDGILEGSIYEIRKFVRLCTSFNPNVIPLLYINPDNYLIKHDYGLDLLYRKDLFLSKLVYSTFVGYAKAQMSRAAHGITGRLGLRRKGLIETYGYDVKAASHTIRLLNMACEILTDGKVNVCRTGIDADELIAIRNGKYNWDEFVQLTEEKFENVEVIWEHSPLPEKPDEEPINKLVTNLIYDAVITQWKKN